MVIVAPCDPVDGCEGAVPDDGGALVDAAEGVAVAAVEGAVPVGAVGLVVFVAGGAALSVVVLVAEPAAEELSVTAAGEL